MIVSEEMYPDIIDIENYDLKQKKDFLYSYFYEYVSCNAPVKKETLMKKWEEAKTLITNCEFILYELKCPTVVEFLLKSMKFAMVGEYICTPATLPDAYKRVSNNVCGILKCLMKKGGDSDSDDDDLVNEEFLKSLNSFDSSIRVDNSDDFAAGSFKSQKIDEVKDNDFKNQKGDEVNHQVDDLKNFDENNQDFEKIQDLEKNYNLEKIQENSSLNLEEKLIIENENDNSEVKVCNKTFKNLQEKLQKAKEELEEYKTNFSNLKTTFLKNMLSSDYSSKKNVLLFNIRLARNEYLIIDKLQTILIYSTGTMLPLSEAEWKTPMQQMEKLCFDLDNDYAIKLELLNDEEYCESIGSISCISTVLPNLPQRDLTVLIQFAFNLYRDNLQRIDSSFNQAPNYPPGFNNLLGNPLMYQQQRPHFWSQLAAPDNFNYQFMQRNNPIYAGWNAKPFGGNVGNISDQNNVNGQWSLQVDNKSDLVDVNAKKEFINYDEISSGESLSDMKEKTHAFKYTEPPESLNNDRVFINNCDQNFARVLEEWKSIWEDKVGLQEVRDESKIYEEKKNLEFEKEEEEEEMGGKFKEEIIKQSSMDKLLRELRARHRGVLEYDLLYCVEAVRKKFNNSLSGLTFAEIIREVEKLLPGRERLQIRNYDRRIFIVKKSPSKSNPWATLDGYQWTNEEFGESECIICMEPIIKFGKVPSYTLRCKHTFHKKCIKNWFNQNQSCPTCRIHCIIDDEFPPLS
ncbi:hypothetical protein G9C98_001648 [Cotesia typhae]|uniref:RING-type domain-containing protein n=1 Tax=Cotesia typhae TaxID=2053667 RepID=A0A8J5QKB4_9HYME|nr:hypothetical protein G9C98_001648 [Cotesia typhae]